MVPRTEAPGSGEGAVVDADLCAVRHLRRRLPVGDAVSLGRDAAGDRHRPAAALPVDALRAEVDAAPAGALARRSPVRSSCSPANVVRGERPRSPVRTVCSSNCPASRMLPPSFIEYGLRAGAAGVVVAACPEGDCEYRFGARWTDERIAGAREPRLRASVARDRARVAVLHAAREQRATLEEQITAFGARLAATAGASGAGNARRDSSGEDGNELMRRCATADREFSTCCSPRSSATSRRRPAIGTCPRTRRCCGCRSAIPGKITDCRPRTAEELAKMPPQLRAQQDCPRERSPVRVRVELDGKHAARRVVRAGRVASRRCGQRLPAPGDRGRRAPLRVQFNDDVRVKGPTLRARAEHQSPCRARWC